MPTDNPFAPPSVAEVFAPGATSQDENIRRQHLNHEASIRSVGLLYFLSALGTGVAALAGLAGVGSNPGTAVVMMLLFGALSAGLFLLGRQIRRLDERTRVPVAFLATVGLLGFPIGTLINGYILYLFFSAKGKQVLSPEYRAIVERTPHIKYKTNIVVIVLAVLLLGLVAVGLIGVAAGS